MIIEKYEKKAGSAGDCLDYLITDRTADYVRVSRVVDMAVHNLPVMPKVPETRGEASELIRALTRSMNSFTRNARLNTVRHLEHEFLHVIISFHPNDVGKLSGVCGSPVGVSLEVAKSVAGEDRAMVLILHAARHLHTHALISSRDTQGRAWNSSFDRYRWNTAAREAEHKYDLTPLTYDPERHSLSPTEHRKLERCGIPDLLDRMRAAICAARSDSPSRELFEQRLANIGMFVSERRDANGEVRGWVFTYGDVSVKGSAIHRGLSYRSLTSGLNRERVNFDPRHEQEVLNVMLLAVADEEHRLEALKHPHIGVRYLGLIAADLRAGKVDRTWDEVSSAAQQRLSARPQLVPVKPQFVKVERADLVPMPNHRVRARDDNGGADRNTFPSRSGGYSHSR